MPSSRRIGVPWRKRDERRDQQPLLAERRPVALGVLDQLVGFRDPDRAAAALQPVVEQDAGDLAALAGAGAVAEKPAAAEAHGILGVVGRGRDDVEGLVDRPRSGEMAAMGLAGIDDAFELGVGQQAVRDDTGGQMRPIARLGRRDRGHRGRLHELGRMRLRAGNADRLQRVAFIERLGDAAALGRLPVDGLIGEFDGLGFAASEPEPEIGAHDAGARRARQSTGRRSARATAVGDRQPRRNGLRDPAEQRRGIGRHARRRRERRRIVGGHPVDHGQARVDGRAVPGIDRAVDRRGEHDAPALLQPDEGVAPGRIVGRDSSRR